MQCKKEFPMKTATIPSLRVDPELRQAAESVLQSGESLSSFVEQSLRANIERRQAQQAFIARGLASRDDAQKTGEYFAAEDVLRELDDMLVRAKAKKAKAKAHA
jgi:predicted transcriptional regulator